MPPSIVRRHEGDRVVPSSRGTGVFEHDVEAAGDRIEGGFRYAGTDADLDTQALSRPDGTISGDDRGGGPGQAHIG